MGKNSLLQISGKIKNLFTAPIENKSLSPYKNPAPAPKDKWSVP